jgi:hypothetical protein
MKRCDINDGTYTGAIASIKVTGKDVTYKELDDNPRQFTFDWNCKKGSFNSINDDARLVVEREPTVEGDETMTTLNVRPVSRNDDFRCVTDTTFWFFDGKYDGDDNGLDCPKKENEKATRQLLDRYNSMTFQY